MEEVEVVLVVVMVAARHLQLLPAFGLSVLREELAHVLLRVVEVEVKVEVEAVGVEAVGVKVKVG